MIYLANEIDVWKETQVVYLLGMSPSSDDGTWLMSCVDDTRVARIWLARLTAVLFIWPDAPISEILPRMCAVAFVLDVFNGEWHELFNDCATDRTVMVGCSTVMPLPPLAADNVCCMELRTAWVWLAVGLDAWPMWVSGLVEVCWARVTCDRSWNNKHMNNKSRSAVHVNAKVVFLKIYFKTFPKYRSSNVKFFTL